MKRTGIFLMAIAAMLSMGIVSCNMGENNNGGNTTDEWVDLGLPSGLLWAKCNLGANAPEEYGNYYAWGETQPKEVYDWSTYRYSTVDGDSNLQTLTKYNTSSDLGTIDNLTTLQAVDDAATQVLGNGARTPTKEEWQELIDNTTVEWTTVNGVNGRKFTGSNGNTLFLPASGGRYDSEHDWVTGSSLYWSSSLYTSHPYWAWVLDFFSDDQGMYHDNCRCLGFSVRAVRQK